MSPSISTPSASGLLSPCGTCSASRDCPACSPRPCGRWGHRRFEREPPWVAISRTPDPITPSPCLIALDARVTIVQKTGESTLTMSDLAAGGLPQGSLITGIEFAQPDGGAVFARVGPRNGPCYATAAIAVVVDTAARKVRTGLGGVGPNALGAPEADEFASAAMDWSRLAIGDDAIAGYAQAVRAACDPITDVTATAAYREHAITVMARRSLARACEGGHS